MILKKIWVSVEVSEFEHYSEENCTRRALDTEMVDQELWKFNTK